MEKRKTCPPLPQLPFWAYLTIPGVTIALLSGTVVLMLNLGGDGLAGGPGPLPGPPQQDGPPPQQPDNPPEQKADVPLPKVPPAATQFQGLIAYWPFEDENPAVLVADRSKNGNDGKAVGATRVDGIRGKALAFAGEDAFFDYGSHPSLNFAGAFTLACWFKTVSASGMLLSQRHSKNGLADIDLFLAGGRLQAHVRRDTAIFPVSVDGKVPVNDDRWHHCALVRSGKDVAVYVDGIVAGRNSGGDAEGPITTDLRALCLERFWAMEGKGSHLGVPRSLTAAVDEFCIFNRALADKEIQALAGR